MFFRFLTLIALASTAIYWCFIRIDEKDPAEYTKLMRESFEMRTHNALEKEPAFQKRHGVQKDIWTENETRRYQIQSEHSDLSLLQKKDKTEATERLEKIICHLPGEITLTADEGIFQHPSEQFIAKKNCHLTQNENFIDGDEIHLDLAQEIVTYKHPKGRLSSGPLHFQAEDLLWNKKENKLYLTHQVTIEEPGEFILRGERGTLTLDQFEPKLLVLEGRVRLISSQVQNKESFAVAQSLTYNPIEKTLLFSSPRRVLFWQEGLTLSASEVLIRHDHTVEGRGDVHFTFDLEEQNFINEFFNNYL
jgi:lipopolysaccharide export system protein LptA